MTFFGLHFQDLVFYTLAIILLIAGLRVITTRNPVYAALYLVLAFFYSGRDMVATRGRVFSNCLGISLRWCGDGAVLICGDDA